MGPFLGPPLCVAVRATERVLVKHSVRILARGSRSDMPAATLGSLRRGAGAAVFFIKLAGKEGTAGRPLRPGCHICLSCHTPSHQSPCLGETGSHGRLCWKCQPRLAEKPLLTLTRPPAGGVARAQPRARPHSLWAWPFLASLSPLWLQPQEANQKVSWGWGAVSRGAGLKWSWWVGRWVGSALNKGSRRYVWAQGLDAE